MISNQSIMKLGLIWVAIFFLWSCNTIQASSSISPTETSQSQSNVTTSPIVTTTKTVVSTFTPEPDYCPRETVQPNILESSSKTDNSKLITFANDTNRNGFDDIYVMSLDGTNRVNITNSPSIIDRFPVWSPNGKLIAFLSNRNYPVNSDCRNMIDNNCVFELFITDSNGDNITQISQEWSGYHSWSPDSKHVTFSSFFPAPGATPNSSENILFLANIHTVSADGSNNINLTQKYQPGGFTNPIWSPDSQKLAFTKHNGIVVVNSDGTGATEYNIPNIREVLYWSKDNSYILFMDKNYQVFKSNLDFSEYQILPIPFISPDINIKFSPNEKWFAYSYFYSNLEKGIFCTQIRIANLETFQNYFVYDEKDIDTAIGDYLKPTSNALGVGSFDWIGNDKILFQQRAYHGSMLSPINDLFIINGDGTELRYITEDVSLFSLQP